MKGISIIIPAWKSYDYIEECLNSLQNQSYFKENDNWEILVGVDGCKETKDKVLQLIPKLKNTKGFWFSKNVGQSKVKNTLAWEAIYDTFLFFDSDDIAMPFLVEEILKNELSVIRFLSKKKNKDSKKLSKRNYITYGQISVKADIFKKVGGFYPIIYSEDKDLLNRLKLNEVDINIFEDKAYLIRNRHENSLTSIVKKSEIKKKCHKIRDNMNKKSVKIIKPVFAKFKEM